MLSRSSKKTFYSTDKSYLNGQNIVLFTRNIKDLIRLYLGQGCTLHAFLHGAGLLRYGQTDEVKVIADYL